MDMISAEPEPMYYKGWAIWASPMGYVVCERNDTVSPDTVSFPNVERALNYINASINQRNKDGRQD